MRLVYDSLFAQVTGRYEEEWPFPGGTLADLIENLAQSYGPRFRQLAIDSRTGDIPEA